MSHIPQNKRKMSLIANSTWPRVRVIAASLRGFYGNYGATVISRLPSPPKVRPQTVARAHGLGAARLARGDQLACAQLQPASVEVVGEPRERLALVGAICDLP